ncbi:MAG: hypothetical protein DRG31_03200 [Deltaproteobacteria bacterium]|nr:MAG: hypothetical protein DRG31_03200 [Deltaproteobacteria bacterium]
MPQRGLSAILAQMLILCHHTGEPYGLLGPQLAATFLTKKLKIPTVVLGITRDFDRQKLIEFVKEHYKDQPLTICFSHLCGRPDLLELIKAFKDLGFRTVLGGPQAQRDFEGEPGKAQFPWRFQGLSDRLDLAYSGPVDALNLDLLFEQEGNICHPWHREIFTEVDWGNLLMFSDRPQNLTIKVAQVLRGVGCPYAMRKKHIRVDPPSALSGCPGIHLEVQGCSFCDVAWDKGFAGYLSDEAVLSQIDALPEQAGRKIPFELIDEYPIRYLPRLIELLDSENIAISQINLVLRSDDILKNREILEKVLSELDGRGIRVLFSSIGFESFSSKILKNLNKGITPEESLESIRILRHLKGKFPNTLLYRRDEGGLHGFIHPTPWDDHETQFELNRAIGTYQLFEDILPPHSTPLIIHHGSALAHWIRTLEERTGVKFKRCWTWIEWWEPERAQ